MTVASGSAASLHSNDIAPESSCLITGLSVKLGFTFFSPSASPRLRKEPKMEVLVSTLLPSNQILKNQTAYEISTTAVL